MVRPANAGEPPATAPAAAPRKVVLLDDCFTTFQEPHIGRAAVALLERAGFAVELAGRVLRPGDDLARGSSPTPASWRRTASRSSTAAPPTACRSWAGAELHPDAGRRVAGAGARRRRRRRVAAAAELADGWLARQVSDNGLSLDVAAAARGRCCCTATATRRRWSASKGTADALRLVPGLDVTVLDAGCCGMAGAFGFEKEHYDLSVKIANLALVPAVNAEPGGDGGRDRHVVPPPDPRPHRPRRAAPAGSAGRANRLNAPRDVMRKCIS